VTVKKKNEHIETLSKQIKYLRSVSWLDEIRNFLEDYSGVCSDDPNIDIFMDMNVTGDDFHEMIENYSNEYEVDMSEYLWYFHTNEEGISLGALGFKPPYARVKRIPVTPQMLADFIMTKKWSINYPEHNLPKRRYDIIFNQFVLVTFILGVILGLILKYV
jgi:hypothetical protein